MVFLRFRAPCPEACLQTPPFPQCTTKVKKPIRLIGNSQPKATVTRTARTSVGIFPPVGMISTHQRSVAHPHSRRRGRPIPDSTSRFVLPRLSFLRTASTPYLVSVQEYQEPQNAGYTPGSPSVWTVVVPGHVNDHCYSCSLTPRRNGLSNTLLHGRHQAYTIGESS